MYAVTLDYFNVGRYISIYVYVYTRIRISSVH